MYLSQCLCINALEHVNVINKKTTTTTTRSNYIYVVAVSPTPKVNPFSLYWLTGHLITLQLELVLIFTTGGQGKTSKYYKTNKKIKLPEKVLIRSVKHLGGFQQNLEAIL